MNELKKRVESKIKRNFVISYYDTETNQAIIQAFKTYCEVETGNNYLLGIKKLLESYSTDWKYDTIMAQVEQLRTDLQATKKTMEMPKQEKKEIKTFGGKER